MAPVALATTLSVGVLQGGIANPAVSDRWSARRSDVAGLAGIGIAARPAPPSTPVSANAGIVTGLQAVTDELRTRLSIPEAVTVVLVGEHPLVMSVQRREAGDDTFLLRIDQRFLEHLTDAEIQAAIAHELGHVWIFTHHPYLHTEALANRIAMRVVSREALAGVYRQMWAHQGIEGDLARFIEEPQSQPGTSNVDTATLDQTVEIELTSNVED